MSLASEQMWTLLLLWLCPLVSLMSACPTGCCCLGAGSLVLCESLGLRWLPRSVPLRTSTLSVARNQLCNVDHQFSAFPGLQELSLGHNLLSRFPRGLPASLESLQLHENHITYITDGSLRKLGNLTRLDLEYNHIRAIQPGALRSLNKLRILTLKGNKLTGVPRRLPPSLTRLDLSENCISALDLPSLSSLVNLQSLKINRNCLRSVPERAFDSLARLRSLDLANNLWACRCDILYLYRWLLSGGVRMAADIVCTEPTHLAHHVLLNLTVLDICPRVPGSNDRQNPDLTSEGKLVILENKTEFDPLKQTLEVANVGVYPHTSAGYYSLGNVTYEGCLSLTKTQSAGSNLLKSTLAPSFVQQKLRDNTTGHYPDLKATSAEETQTLLSTNGQAARPTPLPLTQVRPESAVVVSLLALTCALLFVLTLVLLLLLKKVLLWQRRVAPLDVGSGR